MDEKSDTLERSRAPSYILPPADYPPDKDDQVNLAQYIFVLWRWKRFIIVGTFMCATVAFLVSSLMPAVYEARATLILQPPRFSTELKPAPLSVETYQSILSSDLITTRVKADLVKKQVILAKMPVQHLKNTLSVEIYQGKEVNRPGEKSFMPIIDLVATADSPEKAADLANTWARVFLKESTELISLGKQGSLEFIEAQYPTVSASLVRHEEELKKKRDFYADGHLQLETDWTEQILAFELETEKLRTDSVIKTGELRTELVNETERLKKEHTQKTERLKLEFLTRWKPELKKQNLKVKGAKLAKFQDDLLDIDLQIKTAKDTLERLRAEIQEHPQLIVLAKAITDEALWEKAEPGKSGEIPKELERLKLQSQSLNPVYQNLLDRLVSSQIKYDTLVPKKEHLKFEIARVESEIDKLKKEITEKDIEFFNLIQGRAFAMSVLLQNRELEKETLVKRRALESKNLEKERNIRLGLMKKNKENRTAAYEREKNFEVGKAKRKTANVKSTYTVLASKHESAQLARAEEDPDIKIGALAIAPQLPIGPRRMLNSAIALVVGLMLSVILACLLEYLKSIQRVESLQQSAFKPSTLRDFQVEGDPSPPRQRTLTGS